MQARLADEAASGAAPEPNRLRAELDVLMAMLGAGTHESERHR
jgi:hypothetical protein